MNCKADIIVVLKAEVSSLRVTVRLHKERAEALTAENAAHNHAAVKYLVEIDELRAENEKLRAEVEKLRAALEPFADMGRAMMGRKHPSEAVVQYALALTIKVFHLVAAHEARAALGEK
jgi:hypothetical protein